MECLKQYDLAKEDTLIVEGNHKIDGGELAMYRLLQLKRAPTAVLTSNDLTAFGALRAIHHARLRVPEDISIVGFDDIELSQFTQPPLTTIRLPRTELGRIAFDALFRILRGDSQKGAAYRIETHLVVRSSTSAAYLLPGSQDLESAAVRRGS